MPKITLIVAGGYEFIDGQIQAFSHGLKDNVSHIAALFAGYTWEAQGVIVGKEPYPGFWAQSKDRFLKQDSIAKFIAIEVPDLRPIYNECLALKKTPYGYGDCIRGGVYELTGKQIPDSDFTVDCSEAWTRILRTVITFLPDIEAGCITPEKFYRYLMDDLNGEDITAQVLSGGEIPGLDYIVES